MVSKNLYTKNLKGILLRDIAFNVIGLFLMAIAYEYIFGRNHIVVGGVSGLAIIFNYYIGVPLWLLNLILNLPLFLLGIKILGVKSLGRTLIATVGLSATLYLTSFLPPTEMDMTLIAIFGGVIGGVGLGLLFRTGATTGGTDLLAAILHKYIRHFSIARIMLVLDSAIIILGLFVFGFTSGMYALISVFITSKTIDALLEGLEFAKACFIISDHSELISENLMKELDRGVTSLNGQGMYTKRAKNVILCVVSKKETIKVKEITKAVDKMAFIIVADVREVLGEGFNEEHSN